MKKLLFITFLAGMCIMAHPFYLSVTELKYVPAERALQGSVKIFVNDLEDALKRLGEQKVDLIHPADTAQTRKMLAAYIAKRLSIKVNNSPKNIRLIGFEQEAENIWLYIQVNDCDEPKKIGFSNSILYDYLKEQINIIHLEVNGLKKSTKMVNPETSCIFNF